MVAVLLLAYIFAAGWTDRTEPPPPLPLAEEAKSRKEIDAAEELILPYGSETPHTLTRAYNSGSHRKSADSDERFALDFAMPGCLGWRAQVIAPLSGRVSYGKPSGGKGKNLLIAREDGLTCRLAHLDEILVEEGQRVTQGDPVGLEGNSGSSRGTRCREHPGTHIHLSCYRDGEGVKPEPISGYQRLEELVGETLTAPWENRQLQFPSP